MMLTCIFHLIQKGGAFCPSDLKETYEPAPRKQVLTDETAIAFLAAQGYDVSSLVKNVPTGLASVADPSLKDTA